MASQAWQKAVWDDGTDVMYEVTVRLYPRNLPPQHFLKKDFYSKNFNLHQRKILESWKENGTFDIHSLARKFDISLHYAVQKSVCQLRSYEKLFMNVKLLTDKRNDIAHHTGTYHIMVDNLNEELDDLLDLYMNILDDLENRTGDSLCVRKLKIRDSIENKKIKKKQYRNYEPDEVWHYHQMPKLPSQQKEESSGMSGFTKVALGIGAAAAVGVGLSVLAGAFIGDEKKKEKK